MKKSLIALAVFGAFAGTANAADDGLFHFTKGDTSLSLYGVVDVAYGSVNHSLSLNNTLPNQMYPFAGAAATAPSQSALINGGLSDSRIGLKGSTGIANDVTAIFDFESGVDITKMRLNNAAQTLANNSGIGAGSTVSADSSLNGGIFDRAMWVGLKGSWGEFTYGTQNNPVKDAIGAYDPVPSDTFSPFGESGTVGGGVGSSEQSRLHHSVKYSAKLGSGFDMSVAYQFGNDIRTNYGNTYAARVGYEQGPFGLTAAYSNSKDAVVAGTGAAYGQIKLNIFDVSGYVLAGKYKATSDLTFKAGFEHYQRKAPTDAIQTVGALWGIPVSSVAGGFAAGASQNFDIYFLGGDYNIMPDLNLAVGYYNDKISARTGATNDGKIGVWSSVLKYKLMKDLDLYGAFTNNKFSGNAYPAATTAQTITAFAAGLRYKF